MNTDEGRRRFLKQSPLLAVALPAWLGAGKFCGTRTATTQAVRPARAVTVGGGCEGCEAIHLGMPGEVASRTRIAPEGEPGEPLEIAGRILRADAKTPAPGVVLYVYHTDARGYYTPAPGAEGWPRRHGRLRGWVKSGARGEYAFRTIRPASYPDSTNPQHIHPVVKEPGLNEYWIDEFVFDDDPLLTPRQRAGRQNRGGSGVVKLEKVGGVWKGTRDIVLGLNVPGYPPS
ncbi:MAG TPA: hypothetical protein VGX48_05620 [Pyrinomonadaceae bacterium]|jgi:protocatechuate 3,4-dioxygenase beta subunit|nr:hypothetical protein [Pyrinomonadaceae bacterium]